MMAIAEGRTFDEAIRRTQQIEERAAPFLAKGLLASKESILDYLPLPAEQEKVIQSVASDATGAFDTARIDRTFRSALAESGFREEAFDDYLRRMGTFLAPKRPLTLEDLHGQGLGRVVDRFVHRGGDRVRIVSYLYSNDPRFRRNPPPGLVQSLEAGDPHVTVTGTNVVGRELRKIFLHDSRVAVALGLILVAILLWIDFKSLTLSAIALMQLVSGVVLMLGIMKLLDMQINYANAFVATMIMGVGIDYAIHIMHRMQETGGAVDEGVLETGKGVVIAAATNLAGFGTLAFGSYPAMRSVGIVALIGSLTCLLTSLILVPPLMAIRARWKAGRA
jgi:predicted exporter